jgi:hypothetical protein
MSPMPPLITQNSATQRLQADGLLALGLTVPRLSRSWSNADLTYDSNLLTLSNSPPGVVTPGVVNPPFLAIRTWVEKLDGEGLYDIFGYPAIGPGAVLRLHPQAARRLEQLMLSRLGAFGAVCPVPHTALVRCTLPPLVPTPQWFPPGTQLDVPPGSAATLTFHDARGLIIDPIAVAALFVDLAASWPALEPTGTGTLGAFGTVGDVAHIAAKSAGITVQIVDPHGNPFKSTNPNPTQDLGLTKNGTPALLVQPDDRQVVGLGPGDVIWANPGSPNIRFGWARNSTLASTPLSIPALPTQVPPVTLPCRFLRLCVVDLNWHLLGNRTDNAVLGIDADTSTPPQIRPVIRDHIRLSYLVDGSDVLSAANQVLGPVAPAAGGWNGFAFAVSPTLDVVGAPPTPGPQAHWPAFPAQNVLGNPALPTAPPALAATWSATPHDVVLTVALPTDLHVRVYTQIFKLIDSISDNPSFIRGDGAAAVLPTLGPVSLLLSNPLNLPQGASLQGRTLVVDLVITDRAGNTTMFANINVPITVSTGLPPALTGDTSGGTDMIATANAKLTNTLPRAIAPSPLFAIPAIPPPAALPGLPAGGAGWPVQALALLNAFLGEGNPRIGPRLPTMARFPTLIGAATWTTPATTTWDAVVSGARVSPETRSVRYAAGNPGNPAGPDVHAAGVRVDGAAAFDVAQIALRRTMPLLPTAGTSWFPWVADPNWVAPLEPVSDTDASGQAVRTCAAAVLRTIAVGCESPELAPFNVPADVAAVNNFIAANITGPLQINVNVLPRVSKEILREFYINRNGQRDTQAALRRAFRQARDLVFICSPQFAATSHHQTGAFPHAVELVTELAGQLSGRKSLRVLICLPRWPDFDPIYGGWMHHAFKARTAALEQLKGTLAPGTDSDRVVAFHPNGFPGRHVALRSTVVIVDDVWALVGTSHIRTRGMTFDEGVDVSSFDRQLDGGGASSRIRTFRQTLLGTLLGVQAPPIGASDPEWSRLAGTRSCFDLVADLATEGGLGRLTPFWHGPGKTRC